MLSGSCVRETICNLTLRETYLVLERGQCSYSCSLIPQLPDLIACFMKSERDLADVISMHEMLSIQILLFCFETVATPWLQYVSFGAVLGLQIKQAVNYEY